jgi:hypothetical protein
MGCGCQDKEHDAEIIAEIQRRRELKNTPTYIEVVSIFEGSLLQCIASYNECDITKLIREDDVWVVTMRVLDS